MHGLFTSFWGRFGGVIQIEMPIAVYVATGTTTLLALLGWVGYARGARRQPVASSAREIVIAFSAFWLILLIVYWGWARGDLAPDQARRFFPGLPLLAIFLMTGFARLFSSSTKIIGIGACATAFFALNLFVLAYLTSIFAPPYQKLETLPALGGVNVPIDFGNTIRVRDYRVDPARVNPGDPVLVQIYWQALDDPKEDYWLLLKLESPDGTVAQKDGVPSAGRMTTDWWQKGLVLTSYHRFVIPSDVAPGSYTLRLGLRPFGQWDWLLVRGQEMLVLGKIVVTQAR